MKTLWAYRFTVSRGWIWSIERRVDETNAAEWLAVFQADEPSVYFTVSDGKPRIPAKAA